MSTREVDAPSPMTPESAPQPSSAWGFSDVCSLLEEVLSGPTRAEIVAQLEGPRDLATALLRLRRGMREHSFRARGRDVELAEAVAGTHQRTLADGLNVLHDWDGLTEVFNPDVIPVDVAEYLGRKRGTAKPDPKAFAIALDYYFFYLLVVLSVRVWDDGDPNENLGRLRGLVELLQGSDGSGQRFVSHSETLLILAFSSYQPEELAFFRLLGKARTLARPQRTRLAVAVASIMGCHLRFGFKATYGLDMGLMRADNVVDYAWLTWALAALLDSYGSLAANDPQGPAAARDLEEAILNGFSADGGAYFGHPPAPIMVPSSRPGSEIHGLFGRYGKEHLEEIVIEPFERDRAEVRRLFGLHGKELLAAWEAHRPTPDEYSPLSFRFNFPHNVIKGAVIDGLFWGDPWAVSLDDLLSGESRSEPGRSRVSLARTLTRQARANPAIIRGKPMPVIVYDPKHGAAAFTETLGVIQRESK
jgi:hypothetical protein